MPENCQVRMGISQPPYMACCIPRTIGVSVVKLVVMGWACESTALLGSTSFLVQPHREVVSPWLKRPCAEQCDLLPCAAFHGPSLMAVKCKHSKRVEIGGGLQIFKLPSLMHCATCQVCAAILRSTLVCASGAGSQGQQEVTQDECLLPDQLVHNCKAC